MFGLGGLKRLKNIGRTAERINQRRRIRLLPASSRPFGPKLVRGRGRPRRDPPTTYVWLAFYLALAAALTIVIFKHFVAPAIG